jgi:hypothetical protein
MPKLDLSSKIGPSDAPRAANAEGRDSIVWNIWLSEAERAALAEAAYALDTHFRGLVDAAIDHELTTAETLDSGELKLPSRAARRVSVRVNSTKLARLTAAFETRYGARHAHAFTTASIISTVVRSYVRGKCGLSVMDEWASLRLERPAAA